MTSTLTARTKEELGMGATHLHAVASGDGYIADEHDGVARSYGTAPHETTRRTS
jgi:hypothetical protein